MDTRVQHGRSPIARVPRCQLEGATRDLAWRSFRAGIARFMRAALAEHRALAGLAPRSD